MGKGPVGQKQARSQERARSQSGSLVKLRQERRRRRVSAGGVSDGPGSGSGSAEGPGGSKRMLGIRRADFQPLASMEMSCWGSAARSRARVEGKVESGLKSAAMRRETKMPRWSG